MLFGCGGKMAMTLRWLRPEAVLTATVILLAAFLARGDAVADGVDGLSPRAPENSEAVGPSGQSSWSWTKEALELRFRLDVRGLRVSPTPEGVILSVPGQAHAARPGSPELPQIAATINGRQGLVARVRLKPPIWTTMTDIDVAPVAARVLDDVTTNAPTYHDERRRDEILYNTDAFLPADIVSVQEALMGTQKLVRVECRPVQFNPVRRVARYATVIEGVLVFEPARKGED